MKLHLISDDGFKGSKLVTEKGEVIENVCMIEWRQEAGHFATCTIQLNLTTADIEISTAKFIDSLGNPVRIGD